MTRALLVSLLLIAPAQQPPAKTTQADVRILLDLARSYVEQGKLEEADRTLELAAMAIARLKAAAAEPGVITETPGSSSTFAAGVLRVGGDIREPKKLHHVPPVYPDIAKAAKVQGIVILEAIVSETGDVVDTRVLRSVPLLDTAAIEAVEQWRYTPTLLNGKPVPVVMTVTVNFSVQ